MHLTFRPLHPSFAAETGAVDLRTVSDNDTLARVGDGMVDTQAFELRFPVIGQRIPGGAHVGELRIGRHRRQRDREQHRVTPRRILK